MSGAIARSNEAPDTSVVVAETARLAGMRLVSLDARAQPTYRAVGVDVQWLIE